MLYELEYLAQQGVQIAIFANVSGYKSAQPWYGKFEREEDGVKVVVTVNATNLEDLIKQIFAKWQVSTAGLPNFTAPVITHEENPF